MNRKLQRYYGTPDMACLLNRKVYIISENVYEQGFWDFECLYLETIEVCG